MNKSRELVEMGDFYASSVFTESTKSLQHKGIGKNTFPAPGKKVTDVTVEPPKKSFKDRGPLSNKNGESLKKPLEASDTKGKETFTGVEKFTQEPRKMQKENINTFMNKSIFDRLFEDVMSDNIHNPSHSDVEQADAEALELPGAEDHTEEGEVTITLDKELAKKLHDVLMSVLGEEEPSEEEGSDEEGVEDEAAEDELSGDTLPEATELKEVPASAGHGLTGKNNKVGDETSRLVSKGHGEGKIKDECDAEGTVLPDSKGHSLVGKNNKVASKTSKVGSYVAGLK